MGRGMIAVFYALFESEASLGTGFFYAWGMGGETAVFVVHDYA